THLAEKEEQTLNGLIVRDEKRRTNYQERYHEFNSRPTLVIKPGSFKNTFANDSLLSAFGNIFTPQGSQWYSGEKVLGNQGRGLTVEIEPQSEALAWAYGTQQNRPRTVRVHNGFQSNEFNLIEAEANTVASLFAENKNDVLLVTQEGVRISPLSITENDGHPSILIPQDTFPRYSNEEEVLLAAMGDTEFVCHNGQCLPAATPHEELQHEARESVLEERAHMRNFNNVSETLPRFNAILEEELTRLKDSPQARTLLEQYSEHATLVQNMAENLAQEQDPLAWEEFSRTQAVESRDTVRDIRGRRRHAEIERIQALDRMRAQEMARQKNNPSH
ncbi:MAG: hypothetical protein Q7K43_06485, partial [Candidatus Woesearchaeota archaeon]|nr:hypothetical protein [Candidatus Woesearchaeota archaeon]